jgi:hypothetical protein
MFSKISSSPLIRNKILSFWFLERKSSCKDEVIAEAGKEDTPANAIHRKNKIFICRLIFICNIIIRCSA